MAKTAKNGHRRRKPCKTLLVNFFGLPGEVLLDLPRLVMLGNNRMVVENHRGLLEYTEETVRIKTAQNGEIGSPGRASTFCTWPERNWAWPGGFSGSICRGEKVSMYRWLLDFYHGYLVVMAQGKRLEALLNRAAAAGIYLWGSSPAPGRLLFRVRGKDFPRLRPAFRRCGCRGKILHRSGLPFLLRRLLQNKGRWLGLAFFITAIQVLASFVWVVGVAVENGELPGEPRIREELREIGVRPGVSRGKIKKAHERILEELTIAFPEAAWIDVELRGVVVLVTMAGKTPPPAEEEGPGDIVAAKEGLVSEVIVLEGTPLVKAGDMVSRGDL